MLIDPNAPDVVDRMLKLAGELLSTAVHVHHAERATKYRGLLLTMSETLRDAARRIHSDADTIKRRTDETSYWRSTSVEHDRERYQAYSAMKNVEAQRNLTWNKCQALEKQIANLQAELEKYRRLELSAPLAGERAYHEEG